jgi:hypothetical protein
MKLKNGQCCVYWIKLKHHTDVLSDGYIGVSKNPTVRWKLHFWKSSKKQIENPIFFNAIQKYGWDSLIKEVLIIGTEEYCYEMETKFRPKSLIGWNCNVGGSKPPVSKPRGKDYVSPLKGVPRQTPWMLGRTPATAGSKASEETRAKMSASRKGFKQSPEHIAKRVASRKATITMQMEI